ncbi:hypothetical protein LLEC1_05515 [Akanthomyces lecanii]|uniref:Protein PBN1 n=1 Tax=Cordyceps confragosa TaxID=2714763 RepID=A0A179I485_CORDF|nr:hypothetical protein LLEC1_05515 [Akanthomyces lecanii]
MKLYKSAISRLMVTLAALASHAAANADKIIFTGPEPVTYPLASPSLLRRIFHDDADPAAQGTPPGHASWFMLDGLTPGQRYELRVCWAAIEPTEFTMDVHELDAVWTMPNLMLSLYNYSSSRQAEAEKQTPRVHRPSAASKDAKERTASLLLLRVHAAADYFSHHTELMRSPPPVLVDLILDPYLFNVVPESLLLTAGYIAVVAVATLFLAQWIARRMTIIAAAEEGVSKKRD